MPGAVTLLLLGAFGTGLALWPELFLRGCQAGWRPLSPAPQRVDIVLEPSFPPLPAPGPAGGGRQAAGGQGVRSLTVPALPDTAPIKAQDAIPEPLATPHDANPVFPGGSGRGAGSGPGSGGGRGPGSGAPMLAAGLGSRTPCTESDRLLVPVRRIQPIYTLRPGDSAAPALIVVQVTVEDDGHVSSARAIQGPEFLRQNAEASALGWTFEPLARHGLKGPQSIQIRFRYSVENFRYSQPV